MSLLTALALAPVTPAHACGGFACAAAQPVVQSAERIVFAVDEERDEVEMHVQITYEGPSEDFAWIVPVPSIPDLFLTTGALFTQLTLATQPTFSLTVIEEGTCRSSDALRGGVEMQAMNDSVASLPSSSGGGVQVVGEEALGPYDTVTLRADSTAALIGWLGDNGYDIPANMEAVLTPYVSRDAYFVALKLQKDRDIGDLAPLALRYPGKKGMVPVQLTSISATPDMRMEAYVFGTTRAVPESYLHVQINEAAIDWWTAGSNYNDVITQAANEAGGQAFATDYYGGNSFVAPLWDADAYDESKLREATTFEAWLDAVRLPMPIPAPELFIVLEDLFDWPAGQGQTAWACPECVEVDVISSNATNRLIAEVVRPMQKAQALFDRFPRVTRMTSSLDAIEMTVDPVFVLNHDMGNEWVRLRHNADFVYECGNGKARDRANRRLVLQDGREIEIPSEDWCSDHDTDPFTFIADLGETKAQVIEQTGAEGMPLVLTDHTERLFELVRLHNKAVGFGCNGSNGAAAAGLGLLGVMGLIRRRRSA